MNVRSFFGATQGRTPTVGVDALRWCRRWTFAAGLLAWGVGCAPSIGGAVRTYEHARYPEAMEELRAVETDVCRWNPSDAARYALYRGLTHLALGDLAATRLWFGRVRRAIAGDPTLLTGDDAGRFASASAHLPR
jgi:hypothetical protein